jgi:hypothetical protein
LHHLHQTLRGRDHGCGGAGNCHGPCSAWACLDVALLTLALLFFSVPGLAWGERAHEMVNAAAVEALPEPLRSYFRTRKVYLVEHSIDPDRLARHDPQQRPHHFTEIDAYDSFPFTSFQHKFVLERIKASLALKHGDSIWQIEAHTLQMAEALRRRRWKEADEAAIFAAHYAVDLTQPLHTVTNFDGQLTGQAGIHARFEIGLVNALAEGWVFHPAPAGFCSDLRARIFQELIQSYSYRDVVFSSDRIAVRGRKYSDAEYSLAFNQLAGPLARKRLEAAAAFVGSLWYTAWVRAGKPLPKANSAAGMVGGDSRHAAREP